MYIIAHKNENELILHECLKAFDESVKELLQYFFFVSHCQKFRLVVRKVIVFGVFFSEKHSILFKMTQDVKLFDFRKRNCEESRILIFCLLFKLRFFSIFFCFSQNVNKNQVLENLDLVLLSIDEIIDDG